MIASYITRLGSVLVQGLGKEPIAPTDEAVLTLRAWPGDVDIYVHVNNGRYLTLMDFGRFHHAIRTGLMGVMLRNRWRPILGAATVRYRKEILPLERFELRSRLAAWDEKWFYYVQRFVRRGEVCAEGMVRGVLKQGRKTVPPAELCRAVGHSGLSPEPEGALAGWIAAQR